MGKRMARGAMGWGAGLGALGIVLLVAIAACGDSGGETPTSALTPKPDVEMAYYYKRAVTEPGRALLYGTITGTLTYDEEKVIPEGAEIRISIVSTDERDVFSTYRTPLGTRHFPISFVIHCDYCPVDAGEEYFARVDITRPPFGSLDTTGPRDESSRWIGGFSILGFNILGLNILGDSTLPKETVKVGDTLFLNATKTIVIDSNGLARNIEIPVVPPPTLSGTIEPSEGESTPAGPTGWVYLWDISQRNSEPILVASKEIEVGKQFPIPFSIDYVPEDVDPNGTYVLQAELKRFRGQACQGLYRHKKVYEVITGGNPTHDVQLKITQVDKWGPEEAAHVTGTVAHAKRYEDGDTDPNSEDVDTDPISEDLDTDPRRDKSLGVVILRQSIVIYPILPTPNPDIPWYVGIIDLSENCTLAEIQIDSSIPLPFSFSIPFYSSHVDPDSDYAIRAHNFSLLPCDSGLGGEEAIVLTPGNLGGSIEVEIGGMICF